MSTLECRQVNKWKDDLHVIENFDIKIHDGELLVVVGPSGCGKSTLLRMIAGLEPVSDGSIFIDAEEVNRLEPKDRNVAMVFQNYALYPHMTVYNNMAYGLRMRRISRREIEKRVNQVAAVLDLTKYLQRKPQQLSGGQRQRVAMGRALVRKPKIFLFDEPLSNLDAKLRVQMRLEIKKLQREFGITSIYVTHDQVEAMTLADRLAVIDKGCIQQIGKPLEIYQSPANVFVAGFMGTPAMNCLPARLHSDGNSVQLTDTVQLPLMRADLASHAGRDVVLGFRPEDVLVNAEAASLHFSIRVESIEALGAETYVYGVLPGLPQSIVCRIAGTCQATVGEKIALSIAADSLHLFDKGTGVRI